MGFRVLGRQDLYKSGLQVFKVSGLGSGDRLGGGREGGIDGWRSPKP